MYVIAKDRGQGIWDEGMGRADKKIVDTIRGEAY
jgi:hypothetical protein